VARAHRTNAELARLDSSAGQLVSSAGSAIVAAAKVGRILGRSGWRIARQLPGAHTVEREAQRLQRAAVHEVKRILDIPQNVFGTATSEEARAVLLIQNPTDEAPLRSAMGELLERSANRSPGSSQEYLFGTIISQLVPDEARIIAALADTRPRATCDVVDKSRGGVVLLANASLIGATAGVAEPRNTPTYLARLRGFGLVGFGPEDEKLSGEYDALAGEETVRAAQAVARRPSGTRLRRGTVRLSPLGQAFWAATDPTRALHPALPPG
jgi:hypothetical protein